MRLKSSYVIGENIITDIRLELDRNGDRFFVQRGILKNPKHD